MPLVEQELLTLPEHMSVPPVFYFSEVCFTLSLVLCVCFVDRCPVVLLSFVLSVILRYTDSDYAFGIFKLFLALNNNHSLTYHVNIYSCLIGRKVST